MSSAHRVHLLTLADREFRKEVEVPQPKPAKRNFKGLNLSLSKFGADWDRKRLAAARLSGVLLREDAETLHARVCADERSTQTYDEAASWLEREARYLRRHAGQLEVCASRLHTTLARCRAERQVPAATS